MEARRDRSARLGSWLLAALTALVLAAAGCGGGGGGGGSEAAAPAGSAGRVAVFLTDGAAASAAAKKAPDDKKPDDARKSLEEYSQVLVTITDVELLGSDGPVTLYDGPPKEVDLLDLHAASLLLCMREVPAGTYEKIRLTATKIELVDEDGDVEEADPLANGKIDLNPRSPFTVNPGETVVVELDAENSLHIVATGSGKIQFRPEVFVSVRPVPLPWPTERLVRLQGTVEALSAPDAQELWFVLQPSGHRDGGLEPCLVKVVLGPDSSFFDDEDIEIEFADLAVGDSVTAIGRFLLPAGPEAARVDGMPVFGADLVERGNFLRLTGTVLTSPSDIPGTFLFRLDPGQGLRGDLVVSAHLYEGTKIYGPGGEPATPGDLTVWPDMPPVRARLDAVFDLSNARPDVIHVALVRLEDRPNPVVRASGAVVSFDEATGRLVLVDPWGLEVELFVVEGTHFYRLLPGPTLVSGEAADLDAGAAALVFARRSSAGALLLDDVFVTMPAPAPI